MKRGVRKRDYENLSDANVRRVRDSLKEEGIIHLIFLCKTTPIHNLTIFIDILWGIFEFGSIMKIYYRISIKIAHNRSK